MAREPGAVNQSPLLRVIEAVADGTTTLAALEARLPELSRAKIYRSLQEAEAAGWLTRDNGGWTVGLKAQRLWLAAVEAKRKEAGKLIAELKNLTDPQITPLGPPSVPSTPFGSEPPFGLSS